MLVNTRDPIDVRGDELHAQVNASLDITSTRGRNLASGSVTIGQGKVKIYDRDWEVNRARISFDGQTPPNPHLDIQLSHVYEGNTVYINVNGSAAKPEITFQSDPPIYDQAQLLSLVLTGSPGADQRSGSMQDRAAGVIASMVGGEIKKALRKTLPIDTIQIGSGKGISPGSVTIGKWLTPDLFVAYRRRFEAEELENANEALFEYDIGKSWVLEGLYGDGGKGGADLLWTHSF
jgi:translocation and assembly module TamB